ncbi:MAG: enoyl-CoA hydratase [Acidimicrobiia bacterium]
MEVKVDRDVDARVAVVTIDDADRRNALTLPMVDGIVAALDDLEADDSIGAVVVTGAGPAFCAGADLSHLGGAADSDLRRIYEGFLRFARCPLPTVAAVNGAAVGAGMNLALACDIRLTSPRAKFDTRFLQLGLHPGGGHTWMLERIVGPQTAAAMVLFGEVLDGEAAAKVGLAWRCVPEGELLAAARAIAAKAASAPRELSRRTKSTLTRMPTVATHAEAVDAELEVQVWSVGQPAFAERLEEMRRRITER